MTWINDAVSAIGWMASEAVARQSPAELQRNFQQLGISAEDYLSWMGYEMGITGGTEPRDGGLQAPGLAYIREWISGAGRPTQAAAAAKPKAVPQPTGIPAGVDPSTLQAILTAARDVGVPYELALAMAQQESGFDPRAVGDQGTSFGIYQLHQGGELTSAGLTPNQAFDPYTNARVALSQVRRTMDQHPNASWGQIAAMAQRPADQASYAQSVDNYIGQIQTGQGTLGWGLGVIRQGEPSFQRNVTYGSNPVPVPFGENYFNHPSDSFGQPHDGETGETGQDYPMPVGTQINTPVGGTIVTRDDGQRNWGKAVYVKTPSGWTFFVGHLSSFAVQDGEQVGPGDVLGLSGGAVGSASSGHTTGPHVEIDIMDPSGKRVDPRPYLQQIYQGTTFDKWMGGVFSSSAQPNPFPQKIAKTGDGAMIDLNTQAGQWWSTVDSVWTSVFGMHAPLAAALEFQRSGVNTVQGVQDAINNMPSGIVAGVSIGAFNNANQTAQSLAQKTFGRPIPQSLVKQFFQDGVTTQSDMQLWFNSHSSSDIPPGEYQQVFDQSASYSQSVWNDVPHPDDVSAMWQAAGGTPAPGATQAPASNVAIPGLAAVGAGLPPGVY